VDLARPEAALTAPGAMEALMALARARRPLSAEEIAGSASVGAPGAARATLAALCEHGVVIAGGDGHTLNGEHVLAMAIQLLAGARARVVDRLRMHLASWDPAPSYAALVGSAARGDGGPGDDIDILVVRPAGIDGDPHWRAQREALRADVPAWTGNPAHIIERTGEGPVMPHGAAVMLAGAPPG
jgi:hypothetical protein